MINQHTIFTLMHQISSTVKSKEEKSRIKPHFDAFELKYYLNEKMETATGELELNLNVNKPSLNIAFTMFHQPKLKSQSRYEPYQFVSFL